MRADPVAQPHPPPGSAVLAFAWGGAAVFAVSLAYFGYCYFLRFGVPAPPGGVAGPLVFDALLFTLFAVHHSVLARTGVKTWLQTRIPAAVERSLYTWVASLLFLAVCIWWSPVPGLLYQIPPPLALLGYAVQMAGVALTLRGASAVDPLDLAGVRTTLLARSGTPPRHVPLETHGVYGFVRHPLYFAWALMVFGAPTMTATRAAFAVISTLYLAIAIPWEERNLIEVFGDDYERYRAKVRWRMIPLVY